MKAPFTIFTALTLLSLGGLAACDGKPPTDKARNAAPVETPRRKPGLWKQTVLVEDLNALQSVNLCLDAASDVALSWWSQQGFRQNCSRNEIKRQPDGSWRFSAVCEAGGVRTTSQGSAVGDFNRKYQLRSDVTTVNSPVAQMNGTRKIAIDAEWQGECPRGMNPGDMDLPDGRRVNLLELSGVNR
jgi:hypothetical protein